VSLTAPLTTYNKHSTILKFMPGDLWSPLMYVSPTLVPFTVTSDSYSAPPSWRNQIGRAGCNLQWKEDASSSVSPMVISTHR